MSDERPMSDKCIACGGSVSFTVQMILSSRYMAPRRQHSSKAIGICNSCCNPHAPMYQVLKNLLVVELWMNRNEHTRKLETVPADQKTAAAGE
jgi:hypothetical protein